MKKKIKTILKYLFELLAITTPYEIFLNIINASDELTVLGAILSLTYCIIMVNLFEWCFDINNFEKSKGE